ncbi:MAG: SDR family NAD(P)-dependent oxidoreductase [Pseudomonadota bacterium]
MTEPDYRALLKRSLVAIEQLEAKLAATERSRSEPIAVVGVGCRLPGGVSTPEAYWELLANGVDAVTEVPKQRWDADAVFDPDPDAEGKSYTRWGGFIDQVAGFDAQFFGISPREAVSMDPQHRLLLEVAWEALEHAGIAPASLAGSRAAVFVGISSTDYGNELVDVAGADRGDAYTAAGGAHSIAAGRLSYFLGVHGPNMAVDTACSSSLVAVHLAVQSLRNGETSLALAGGVNLTLTATGAILTSRARMMSFDGRCKTFDASADGYVRAEGSGIIVLKRLSDAQRDGDRILAVIRGSAVNQDGRSSGLTAPNGAAQEAVIRDALANAGLSPADISVIEAHGTGTSLGDPIEMNALGRVFGERPASAPLLVASVKTNLGHLEAAAGAASIIKVVLALQQRTVPKHLHLNNPNPLIAWDTLPVRVPLEPTPWRQANGGPRRAGVSSFGFSGTNAHVVLEEAPPSVDAARAEAHSRLLVLSGQTDAALREQAARFRAQLTDADAAAWQDACFTAGYGRSHLPERLSVVAQHAAQAVEKLDAFASDRLLPGVARGRAASAPPEIAFLFTGQGAQFFGMARELYASQPAFRSALDACAAIVDPLLERPLLAVVMNDEASSALLDDTAYTQPALFAIEYALVQLWRSWGVEPTVVLGHSVGEYVAACIAGMFSLEDGLRLIAHRGRLMSRLPRDGTMAVVFAGEARVAEALRGLEHEVSIGAVNGPESTVISGRTAVVEAVVARLNAEGVETQRLNVSHAFHSPLMDPMLDEFELLASRITISPPRIGLVSNVTGRMAGNDLANAAYFRRHVREAVRFADGIATLHAEKIHIFIEIGPSPTLLGMAKRCPAASAATWLPSLRKAVIDTESMLQTLAELHVLGQPIAWRALAGAGAKRAVLPRYSFQRERYWHELTPRALSGAPKGRNAGHPLLGTRLSTPLPIYQCTLSLAALPWLSDHRIYGVALFPVTAFLEAALAAARDALGDSNVALEAIVVREGLPVPAAGTVTMQVVLSPTAEGSFGIEVYSAENDPARPEADPKWRLHASANASRTQAAPPALPGTYLSGDVVSHDVAGYYERLLQRGANYGPTFRGIKQLAGVGSELLGRVCLPEGVVADDLQLHPALLDACLQLVGAGVPWDPTRPNDVCVPVGIDRFRVFRSGVTDALCHAVLEPLTPGVPFIRADIVLFAEGAIVAELRGLELQRVSEDAILRLQQAPTQPDWLLEVEWQKAEAVPPATAAGERWLLLGEQTPLADALTSELERRGAAVTVAHFLDRGSAISSGSGWTGIVRLPPASVPDASGLPAWCAQHQVAIQSVLTALPRLTELSAPLWFVTRGSQAVAGSNPNLAESPVWGLAGVIANEYPALRTVRVDLEPTASEGEAAQLASALLAKDAEDRVALRAGQRYVARLVTGTLAPSTEVTPQRLEIDERGVLENLRWRAVPRPTPSPGQVEIRVLATGLNFRDVLNALGMYPGDPGPLGNECAGVISALGEGVHELAVGDEVVSMTDQSFATFVLAPAVLTVKKPQNISFSEAATIPVTFLTAQYALFNQSRMKPGDRVLVHAATGGVGMAAMQLARRAGATIFATAGSPAKRALALALGAHHLSDSRSLAFVEDFREATDGEGLDIVLNSLAGDFIPASLGLLRAGGRFVEIGKTGIWDAAAVAKAYPGLEYYPLYLGEVTQAEPTLMRDMLQRLMNDFESGALQPLPQTLYPIEKAQEAFRFMGQGRHTGKIVLTQRVAPEVRANATYLISGGLGGLGLACARGLVERGARHVVLLGRRAPTPEAERAIDALTGFGATITVVQGDVSVEADVASLMQQIRSTLPPLRGVLHAAGSVDDGMLVEQDWSRFERVMAPKVAGTWHLHALTHACQLDFFVMFSSGAALLGSPGQGNYAAANSFMDGLAYVRQAEGRHGLSINWGSWAEVGMAASVSEAHRRRWAEQGLRMIAPRDGVRMLNDALRGAQTPQIAILPLDRARLPRAAGPFFQRLLETEKTALRVREAAPVDLAPRILAAEPAERAALISAFLCEQLVRVLAVDRATQFRTDQPVLELGLDSLMAMELRNRVQGAVKVRLSVADLLGGQTIDQLTAKILQGMALERPPQVGGASSEPATGWEEGSL